MMISMKSHFLTMDYTGGEHVSVIGSVGPYTLEELKEVHDVLGRMVEQMEHDKFNREYQQEQKEVKNLTPGTFTGNFNYR